MAPDHSCLADWTVLDNDQEEKQLQQTALRDESLDTAMWGKDDTKVRHTVQVTMHVNTRSHLNFGYLNYKKRDLEMYDNKDK